MKKSLASYYAADLGRRAKEERAEANRRQDAHDRAVQRAENADRYGDDYNDHY